jgi:hypothetical protein
MEVSGRCRRLPARTPLRTVRESFPSYGSSPHKTGPLFSLLTDPLPGTDRWGRAAWRYSHAAMVASAPLGGCSQTHQPAGAGRHLLSGFTDGSTCFLAFSDQTDVGLSSALPLALASSVLPMLRPLTCLAVGSARSRGRAGLAAFPCSTRLTG